MNLQIKLIKLREWVRYHTICAIQRHKLINRNFTWISSNCTGAIITHELNCRFNSPTVNLYIEPKDFIKFVRNIEAYESKKLKFDSALSIEKGYPVAVLEDIKIFFMHYQSKEEAEKKWVERYKRINKNNMFIMMSERDGCSFEDLRCFDQIPFENKIVLTKKPYAEIKSAVYIPGFENEKELGDVFRMPKKLCLKKYYDSFDFVKWLNNEK